MVIYFYEYELKLYTLDRLAILKQVYIDEIQTVNWS